MRPSDITDGNPLPRLYAVDRVAMRPSDITTETSPRRLTACFNEAVGYYRRKPLLDRSALPRFNEASDITDSSRFDMIAIKPLQ